MRRIVFELPDELLGVLAEGLSQLQREAEQRTDRWSNELRYGELLSTKELQTAQEQLQNATRRWTAVTAVLAGINQEFARGKTY